MGLRWGETGKCRMAVSQADAGALSAVVTRAQAEAILDPFRKQPV